MHGVPPSARRRPRVAPAPYVLALATLAATVIPLPAAAATLSPAASAAPTAAPTTAPPAPQSSAGASVPSPEGTASVARPTGSAPAPTAGGGAGDVTGPRPSTSSTATPGGAPKPGATATPKGSTAPEGTAGPEGTASPGGGAAPGGTASSTTTGSTPGSATEGTPTPGATPQPSPSEPVEVLTPEQADALAAAVRAGTADLAQATADLARLREKAGKALEDHADAKREAADAVLAEQEAKERAAEGAAAAETAQEGLNRLAADAYRAGPLNGRGAGLEALLGADDPTDFLRRAHDVRTMAAERSLELSTLQDQLSQYRVSLAEAATAAAKAAAAEQRVRETQEMSSTLVVSASRLVSALAVDLSGAGTAQELALALTPEERTQRAQALIDAAAPDRDASVVFAGTCSAVDLSAYPNGMLPRGSLCPVHGAPGHLLRADAAAAFDAMSKEYQQVFGAPICMTDSYRDLAMQHDLFLRKPTLAAIPGTSNHGWGLAVDLCAGVEDFGTPQHEWLLANSFQFGWFHPGWAAQGGSRPEPWHWEFSG